MSAVCILTPVVIAAWPAFSAAVVAAATSLGYQAAVETRATLASRHGHRTTTVELEVPRSGIVTSSLGRDQELRFTRDDLRVTFRRDARGHPSVCVTGDGRTEDDLRALGSEFAQRVVQQYVYQRLMSEMQARGYHVVEETAAEDTTIHLRVRHWDAD